MLYSEDIRFCLIEHSNKLSNCKLCPVDLCRFNNSYLSVASFTQNYYTNDWIVKSSITLRGPCSSIRDGFSIDEHINSDYAAYRKDKSKFEFASLLDVLDFLLSSGIIYLSFEYVLYFTRIKDGMGKL